jgi:signal transduction histidine kinase/CheY-like chemotaxis protein
MPANPPQRSLRARPLRHQLLLLAALGLLPLALLGAWGVHELHEQHLHDIERNTLDLSRALASGVAAELQATITGLAGLAGSDALRSGDLRAFHAQTQSVLRAHPGWLDIVLTDSAGAVVFRSSRSLGAEPGEVIERRSLDEAMQRKEVVVGGIARGPRGLAALPVRWPVVENGRLRHVLSVVLRPDGFLRIVQQQKAPPQWVISVFDRDRRRVARSKDQEGTVARPATPSLDEVLREGRAEGNARTVTLEGEATIAGYTRLSAFGWTVTVGAPQAEVQRSVWRSLAAYAAAVLASLLACTGLALWLAQRISAPIQQLARQAALLGEGHPVVAARTGILELDQMGAALQAASEQRLAAQREREALLQSRQLALARAEEAGRAKDEFMAVLGHELRNPLAPIVSALALLDLKGDARTEAERRVIGRQVDHMKRLVDDLLDLSRIARGQLSVRTARVDLNAVAERAIEAVTPLLRTRRDGIDFTPQAQPVWVMGDETRLVQVATNLLTNALRFSPEGGVIALEIGRDDGQACLRVRDAGIGMSTQTLANVFKPFYQAPQSLARNAGGLGLGLAIVQSIVDAHGGRVGASSAGEGLGSVFEVLLPLAAAAPDAAPMAAAAAPTVAGSGRVLVVDDNLDAAETTAALLEMEGFTVCAVHSGREALQALEAFQPDVCVLDIGLPDMNGYALAQALRASSRGWRGRLVALTGYGQAGDKALAEQAGFDAHLVKPVDAVELLQALQGR